MDLASEPRLSPGPIVSPIVGNTNNGGGLPDGTGQALYAVNVGGQIQVWRTRAGWRSLLEVDGSVDYLTTIVTGPFQEPTTTALNRIGGVLYAVVTGGNAVTLKGGTWIYRDTSAGKDGTGPWVLHGTVAEGAYDGTASSSRRGYAGGEILVGDGMWAVNRVSQYGTSFPWGENALFGVATSSDGGVTWTTRLEVDFRFASGLYGQAWSPNFARFGGYWYASGYGGSSGDYTLYRSPDLITWAGLEVSPDHAAFPFSTPTAIYRFLYPTGGTPSLQVATAAPVSGTAWSPLFNIMAAGSDLRFAFVAPLGNALAAFSYGNVMRLSSAQTQAPPCRIYPREDALGLSSAPRLSPTPRGQQTGFRERDYY